MINPVAIISHPHKNASAHDTFFRHTECLSVCLLVITLTEKKPTECFLLFLMHLFTWNRSQTGQILEQIGLKLIGVQLRAIEIFIRILILLLIATSKQNFKNTLFCRG